MLTLRKTCLTICATQVNHRSDIEALVRLVNLCGEVEAEELTTDQAKAACAIAGTLGAAVPEVPTINFVGLLGHWKALASILSLVGVQVTRQLQNFGKVIDLPEAVDSHFHIDRLCKKTGLEITAFR